MKSGPVPLYTMSFSGRILERGFWLYVWRIRFRKRVLLYVGRTGDSSSRYAASLFSRVSRHLDSSPRASANMLLRQIQGAGLDPLQCRYEIVALGPLFPEQPDLAKHRRIRDLVAPLERELAEHLSSKGYDVLGNHPSKGQADVKLLRAVLAAVDREI